MRTFLFWLLAFIITAATAVYQRATGPTYPVSGKHEFYSSQVEYKFKRSEDVGTDCVVEVKTDDPEIVGKLFWRRYKYDTQWNVVDLRSEAGALKAELPSQPPAGKLEYYVEIYGGDTMMKLPQDMMVIIRYKGAVPLWILIPHVFFMFGAMLLSTRTGLEFFRKEPNLFKLTYWTIGFLAIGGFLLGPAVQLYAFGAWWTGFPFGTDLTDNKTLIAMVGWLIALYMMKKSAKPKKWVLIGAVVLLLVYMIPHSALGSELDYSTLEKEKIKEIISE